jgi:hypothetical protein
MGTGMGTGTGTGTGGWENGDRIVGGNGVGSRERVRQQDRVQECMYVTHFNTIVYRRSSINVRERHNVETGLGSGRVRGRVRRVVQSDRVARKFL